MSLYLSYVFFFFFQAEDGIRDLIVTGVQTCALPISGQPGHDGPRRDCGLPRAAWDYREKMAGPEPGQAGCARLRGADAGSRLARWSERRVVLPLARCHAWRAVGRRGVRLAKAGGR